MTVANQSKHSPVLQNHVARLGNVKELIYQRIWYSKKAFSMARTKQQDGRKLFFKRKTTQNKIHDTYYNMDKP